MVSLRSSSCRCWWPATGGPPVTPSVQVWPPKNIRLLLSTFQQNLASQLDHDNGFRSGKTPQSQRKRPVWKKRNNMIMYHLPMAHELLYSTEQSTQRCHLTCAKQYTQASRRMMCCLLVSFTKLAKPNLSVSCLTFQTLNI